MTNNVIDLTLSSDEDEHDGEVVIVKDVHSRPNPTSSTKATALPQPSNSKPARNVPGLKPSVAAPSTSRPIPSTTPNRSQPLNAASKPPKEAPPQTYLPSTTSEWSCHVCTLLNPAHAQQCDACTTRRPFVETIQKSKQEGSWSCLTCGEAGMPHDFWTCSWCGTVKLTS